MNFGTTNNISGYYSSNLYQKIKSAKSTDKTGFLNSIAAISEESTENVSFEEMWKSRYTGAYYHTMDASNIPMDAWCRNDYPFEKFFQDNVDESILNWTPNGPDPAMDSDSVQSRLHSIAGQKSIVVPPALEEKMKNNPALAKQIMAKIESYIAMDEATTPDRISSYLIVLDENGEIARCRASSHGGNITGPTEEEMRQFEAEQAAKKKRHEEYERIAEENDLKRKLQEQIIERKQRQGDIIGDLISNTAIPSDVVPGTVSTDIKV